MNFKEIQSRLINRIRQKVRNGEITERGFARLAGISQPHINKVLKGSRTFSPDNSDLVLKCLHQNILDLFTESELQDHVATLQLSSQGLIDLPVLQLPVGPGSAWTGDLDPTQRQNVPCSVLAQAGTTVLAKLAEDPAMRFFSDGFNLAAMELLPPGSHPQSGSVYAVERGDETVLRSIRRGARCLYLVSDLDWDEPLKWEVLPNEASGSRVILRGRVLWFGRRERGQG